MGLTATKKSKSSIPPLETGVYLATCVGVVDLGEQNDKRYGKIKEKVMFIFEVMGEFVEIEGEAKPRWQSIIYTNSINDKANLYNAIKAWRGYDFTDAELESGFDNSQMLGRACQIQVFKESGQTGEYNYIQSIMGIPKGTAVDKPVSEIFLFNMDDDVATVDKVFEILPGWIQDKIKASSTWVSIHANTKQLDVNPETGEVITPPAAKPPTTATKPATASKGADF